MKRRHLEDDMLRAYIEWCRWKHLDFVIHVPNETYTSARIAAMQKAKGLTAGVPDILGFYKRGRYCGFAIEFKTLKGRPTERQKAWLEYLRKEGWAPTVCYTTGDAINFTESYLALSASPDPESPPRS